MLEESSDLTSSIWLPVVHVGDESPTRLMPLCEIPIGAFPRDSLIALAFARETGSMRVVVPVVSTDICLLAEVTTRNTLRFLDRCQFTEAPRVHEARGFLTGPVAPYRDSPVVDRAQLLTVIHRVYEALDRQRGLVGEVGWGRLVRESGMDRLPIFDHFQKIEEFEKLSFSILKLVRIKSLNLLIESQNCQNRFSAILTILQESGSDSALAISTGKGGNLRFSVLLILAVTLLFLLKGFSRIFSAPRQYIIG